jgi:hypothetical protein
VLWAPEDPELEEPPEDDPVPELEPEAVPLPSPVDWLCSGLGEDEQATSADVRRAPRARRLWNRRQKLMAIPQYRTPVAAAQ